MTKPLCPLCQQANFCKAGTAEQNHCWCMTAEFPAGLLAQAPDQSRCICADCLRRFQTQSTEVQQFNPE